MSRGAFFSLFVLLLGSCGGGGGSSTAGGASSGSVLNPTDERAPFAPHEQGYDACTHNPLGRVFQVGLRYTLGNG